MNPSFYHTSLKGLGRNPISHEKNQFQIRTNSSSHWNKSRFTFEEIPFHNGTNSISHLKKSHFTLEQIQFRFGTNPTSNWHKFNFILEQIQYHIAKNQISHWGDSMSKVREKRSTSKSGFFLMKCER